MKVVLGADHAGFVLKQSLCSYVRSLGHEAQDLGTHSEDSVDYPDFAVAVARAVASKDADRGILVCGTGLGMAMVANKVEDIRAAPCFEALSAQLARAHNDANVLTLGSRLVGPDLAEEIVRRFLEHEFEGGRHRRRLDLFL